MARLDEQLQIWGQRLICCYRVQQANSDLHKAPVHIAQDSPCNDIWSPFTVIKILFLIDIMTANWKLMTTPTPISSQTTNKSAIDWKALTSATFVMKSCNQWNTFKSIFQFAWPACRAFSLPFTVMTMQSHWNESFCFTKESPNIFAVNITFENCSHSQPL